MKFSKNRISYVKNPLARNSFLCLGLGIISLGLGAAAMSGRPEPAVMSVREALFLRP